MQKRGVPARAWPPHVWGCALPGAGLGRALLYIGEFCAAFAAPGFYHFAASAGTHTANEAMLPRALPLFRLKRPFHALPPYLKPTVWALLHRYRALGHHPGPALRIISIQEGVLPCQPFLPTNRGVFLTRLPGHGQNSAFFGYFLACCPVGPGRPAVDLSGFLCYTGNMIFQGERRVSILPSFTYWSHVSILLGPSI